MKRCPTCNRTYPDETLNFCLADGSFLSDEDDLKATKASPPLRHTDMPTVILPTVQATSENTNEETKISSKPVFTNAESRPVRKNRFMLWVILGLVAIGITVIVANTLNSKSSSSSNNNSADAASPVGSNSNEQAALNSNMPSATASPNPKNVNTDTQVAKDVTPTETPGNPSLYKNLPYEEFEDPPSKGIGGQKETPNVNETPTATPTAPVDYNQTFSPREVTQKARILAKPEPQYTPEAKKNQISGTVVIKAVFNSSGEVTNIRAVSGLPYGLTEKAIEAAKEIRFAPAMKDGRVVSQFVQIEYNFNLY